MKKHATDNLYAGLINEFIRQDRERESDLSQTNKKLFKWRR